ncbi:hypothetical protein BGX27_007325 [Mortierella sp. AM989]|nr:hypothetical protein BGX27_007325 [Mortierella sp. AM989]
MTASSKLSPPASAGASSSSTPATSEPQPNPEPQLNSESQFNSEPQLNSEPQPNSWSGTQPDADNVPAVSVAEVQSDPPIISAIPSSIRLTPATLGHQSITPLAAESISATGVPTFTSSTGLNDSTGFKIRIPRDLPNIPAAFRKRGAIRSQPSTSSSARYSPAPPAPARLRSNESETLYQTKLVMSPREQVDNGKRTHNDMLSEDSHAPRNYLALGLEKKAKTIKPDIDTLEHLTANPANLNHSLPIQTPVTEQEPAINHTQALITHITPVEAQESSTSTYTITDNIKQEEPTDIPMSSFSNLKRQRSRTKSEPGPPTPVPVRFPTPTSIGGGTAGDIEETSQDHEPTPMESVILSAPVAPVEPIAKPVTSTEPAGAYFGENGSNSIPTLTTVTIPPNMPETDLIKPEKMEITVEEQLQPREDSTPPSVLSTVNSTPDPNDPMLPPLELVRLGTTVLDRLLSNPVCKNFVNKVPENVTNYHAVIKKPMDLTTIEHKLWRSIIVHQSTSKMMIPSGALIAAASYKMSSEGYLSLQEFEKDLQRIYRNAIYFNPPHQTIHKEAQSYEALYNGLLQAFREHRLVPESTVPQEYYTPSLVSLSKPGPIYLFRAHQVREMDRKMTDISVDLFATLHQPLLEVMYTTEELSPEKPQFARLYINKNRSLLDSCRDDPDAKVIIFSDLHVRKASTEAPRISSGGGSKSAGNTKMVGIKARAMIVKPIGERHEMITVGDLDCPSAWIMVACVKAFDWEVDVPTKFEKGVLTKLRHEVVSFGANTKLSPEHMQKLLDSVGLQLPGFVRPVEFKSEPVQTESYLKPANIDSELAVVGPSSPPTGYNVISSSPVVSATPLRDLTNSNEVKAELIEPKIERQDISLSERLIPDASIEPEASDKAATPATSDIAKISKPSSPSLPSSPSSVDPEIISNLIQDIKQDSPFAEQSTGTPSHEDKPVLMEIDSNYISSSSVPYIRPLTAREEKMLRDLKDASREKNVPYISWNSIEPTLTVDSAHGLFKRIYHVKGNDGLVIQNFKEMDAESFEQRVREVVCLLKLRGSEGVGQIQAIIDDEKDHLVGLSMTKYAYTLKAYATSARRHPSPRQKLSLVRDMVAAISAIHRAGLAHRDLSEVNIMVDEDPVLKLEDNTPKPWVRVIDFGKSVFVEPDEVRRWSVLEPLSDDVIRLLPLVILPPDHGYKLYRSILTLPRTKFDHSPLPPVDPRLEDVYSLGVLIWRTFSGKSPWNGAIEDDLKTIRYLVRTDAQIKFQLEREVAGRRSRELLLKCLTADAETRSTSHQLKEWLEQPEILAELLNEFEALGGGRKRVRKNLD